MRIETKRTIVKLAVASFFAWPFVHFLLVSAYGVNPWKLAGWAMYVQPNLDTFVQIRELRDGRLIPVDVDQLSPDTRSVLDRFQKVWDDLGRLVKPDRIARSMLHERTDLEGVSVASRRYRFDAASARFVLEETEHVYRRLEGGSVEVSVRTTEYPRRVSLSGLPAPPP